MTDFDSKCPSSSMQSLRPRQIQFVSALLTSSSITEAARRVKVSERTARRWIEENELIKQALEDTKKDIYQSSVNSLKEAMLGSIDVLKACMSDIDISPVARIKAAEILLKTAIEVHSLQEIEERINSLERLVHVTSERNGHSNGKFSFKEYTAHE